MPTFKDYYESLGVSRSASSDEIQRAYRTLARKYHPDMSKEPGHEQRFKEVSEAYEVLKDPTKRKRYDMLGANYKAGQDFRPPPGWNGGASARTGSPRRGGPSAQDAGSFSDFFETIFGGGGGGQGGIDMEDFLRASGGGGRSGGASTSARQPRPRAGADHEAEITVSLAEAVRGGTRQVKLHTEEADGKPPGDIRSYDVKIPPGITSGSTIRLSGQGGPGRNGGPAGDLLLRINIAPDPRFRFDQPRSADGSPIGTGHDLVTIVPLMPAEAALGAKVDVPTVDGELTVTIPPGSQSGQRLRLRGHGIPKRSGERGDLFAELRIVVPHALSDEERAAYEQLARATKANPRE